MGWAQAMRKPPPAFFSLEAAHDGADCSAVYMRDAGHIENDACFLGTNEFVDLLLETRTLRPAVNAALDFQGSQTRLNLFLCELQNHDAVPSSPSYGNCRINRTQSPSAENSELPQPQGTNEAVF